MKKVILTAVLALACASMTGCMSIGSSPDDVGEHQAETQKEADESETQLEEKNQTILEEMDVREDIQAAIKAAGQLSGRNFVFTESGEIYFGSLDYQNFAYAYYDMPVERVYANDAGSFVLAIMEDGSVYNGTTPLVEDDSILDIAWKTHSTNVDAYMLAADGSIYFYNPYGGDLSQDNSLDHLTMDIKFTALCRAESYPIFFGEDGKLYFPSIFYSGGSAEWTGIETSGWENVVVAACAYSETGECTVAAISADGTVTAQGACADDILAMGELSYITMFDDGSLIAGLTPEGTLTFAGSRAEEYSAVMLSDIAGVKAFGDELYAIGKDETVYKIAGGTVSAFNLNETAGAGREYCLSTSGEFFSTDAETEDWQAENIINASAENRLNLLYYLGVSGNEYNRSRGITANMHTFESYDEFKLQDINGDGQEELIMYDKSFTYITCVYNGTLSTSCSDDHLDGYYPETGIIATSGYGSGGSSYSYGKLINGDYKLLLRRAVSLRYNEASDDFTEQNYYSYYGDEDLPYTDAEGEALREDNKNRVSEAEYEALLLDLVGNEEMQEFSYDDCLACTQENFKAVFFNRSSSETDV